MLFTSFGDVVTCILLLNINLALAKPESAAAASDHLADIVPSQFFSVGYDSHFTVSLETYIQSSTKSSGKNHSASWLIPQEMRNTLQRSLIVNFPESITSVGFLDGFVKLLDYGLILPLDVENDWSLLSLLKFTYLM